LNVDKFTVKIAEDDEKAFVNKCGETYVGAKRLDANQVRSMSSTLSRWKRSLFRP
jgi:hypothetical protein